MNDNLYSLFVTKVTEFPDRTAVVYGDERLSYQDISDKIDKVSSALQAMGARKGECAVIVLPNTPEFIILFYALVRLGLIVLPVNHLFQQQEIEHYLIDSQAKYIFTDDARLDMCSDILKASKIQGVVISTGEGNQGVVNYKTMLETTGKCHDFSVDVNTTAIYMYSSGSTGRPKRISRSHSQLIAEAKALSSTIHLSEKDAILCLVPLYHTHGLGNGLLAATCNGAKLVLLEQVMSEGLPVETPFMFRCARVLQLMKQEEISIFPAVPYLLDALSKAMIKSPPDLSHIRLCFSAGNFLEKSIFDNFKKKFNCSIYQLYGCTEGGALSINVTLPNEKTWNAVGRPLNGVTIDIVDDNGNTLEQGDIGELLVTSPSLTHAYHNMPELNNDVFKQGGFLTGDLGRYDEHGMLYITGRKKLLIDTGGRKVDPIEIEDVLRKHQAIQEVVVVGKPQPGSGELIKAVIVLHEALDKKEIFKHCHLHLASYKVPKIIDFIDEIPKSPLGKILRKSLV